MSLENMTSEQLVRCIERFPYYQTARLLYLKKLKESKDYTFHEEMQKAALYVPDNEILYSFCFNNDIETNVLNEEKKTIEIDQKGSDGSINVKVHSIKEIETNIKEEEILPITEVQDTVVQDEKSVNPTPVDGEPSFARMKQPNSKNARPTTDYVSYMLQEESELEDNSLEEKVDRPLKGQQLIDDFIKNGSSRISLQDEIESSPESLISQESEMTANEEDYFTETLAKIYIKQGRYDKALEIIRKLMSDYPKKNSYFADQIRFLEKLIINNKSKK